MDTFVMLEELLEQDQFELLPAKEGDTERRLVYLMNDAVESFLVFRGAALTGHYLEDYEGALTWSMSRDAARYVLVVRQGDNAVTLLFENLDLEVHLYNYGEIAHFWVPGYEYLRQLEYRIAILRDKCEYLGPEYCTPEERRLAHLAYFPPLNYCCYPAVPAKYIVPKEEPWVPSEAAFETMEELAEEVKDRSLLRLLAFYKRFPKPVIARLVAGALHQNRHTAVIDLLTEKLKKEAAVYPNRSFGEKADQQLNSLLEKARMLQQNLAEQGVKAEVLREEPFTTARDSLDFQVFLMIWKKGWRNRKVEIKKLTEKM